MSDSGDLSQPVSMTYQRTSNANHSQTIQPNTTMEVSLGSVALDNVTLWWPHTHGTGPYLCVNPFMMYLFQETDVLLKHVDARVLTIRKKKYDHTVLHLCQKCMSENISLSLPSSLSLSLCRYSSEFTFVLSGVSQVIASTSVRVGIRHVDAVVDPVLGGRLFKVNGMSLYLEGGNWIATDQVCDGVVSLAFCSRSVSTCTQACAWLSLSLSLFLY